MNTLYWLVTITDRHSTDAFLALYEEHGITVSLRTVGAGTAVRETLSTLGLEQTEKAVLFAMITAETWPGLQKDLRRKMRIDVPGTGIAFIIPVSSIGGKRALQFLTEHQTFALKEESTLKDTRYELLLVIANQGHTGSIMDAARAAGAGGGTVIHAKGTGMEGAAHFMGVELVNEKELVLIVSRTTLKNQIMQAIMQGAGPKAGAIVFSLPVTDTAGLRNTDDPVEQAGIDRAMAEASASSLILAVFDGSKPISDEDMLVLARSAGHRAIAVVNKVDLPQQLDEKLLKKHFLHIVPLSAKTGDGLDKLLNLIPRTVGLGDGAFDGALITNARQAAALARAAERCEAALYAAQSGMTPDAVVMDAEGAITALGEITGETVTDAVVTRIFSDFCVGK